MSKIITKQNIQFLIENTIKEVMDSYVDETTEPKPDFLDLDDDGDTEEPMKKAAKEKEETEESTEDLQESISNKELLDTKKQFERFVNYKN
jgi:hypothetical protein